LRFIDHLIEEPVRILSLFFFLFLEFFGCWFGWLLLRDRCRGASN
jgi:hypothetical protein